MTPEQQAYELAESRIAEAKAGGWKVLNIGGSEVEIGIGDERRAGDRRLRHLARIPPELSDLTGLQRLDLDKTQVADIEPIRGITGLRTLWLDGTQVADLEPIRGITGLQTLNLNGTQVADLGPVAGLTALRHLEFRGIPACAAEPELEALSKISDVEERTEKTLAWLQAPARRGLTPEDLPEPDAVLPVTLTEGRLDVPGGAPTPEEAADPLRRKLFERLKGDARALARLAGNTQHRLADRARRLQDSLKETLEETDLVDVYLELVELQEDLAQDNDARLNPYEPEALTQLRVTVKTGGGVVYGTQKVDLIEARAQQMLTGRAAGARNEIAREVAEAIIARPELFGDRLREYLSVTLGAGPDGRLKPVQQTLDMNTIIKVAAISVIGSSAVTGIVGNVASAVVDTDMIGLSLRAGIGALWNWITINGSLLISFVESYGSGPAGWIRLLVDDAEDMAKMSGIAARRLQDGDSAPAAKDDDSSS